MEENSVGVFSMFTFCFIENFTHTSFLPGGTAVPFKQTKPYPICIQIAQLIPVILTLQFVNKHTFPLLIIPMIKHIPVMMMILKSKSILMTMEHWENLFTIDF